MLGGEWAIDRRQLVVVEAINKDGQVGGNRERIEGVEAHTMAAFRIRHGTRVNDNAGGCGCAHLLMICSSVLTENFLYAVNWCKLRQCCLGVSTSTRACVGNQKTSFVSGRETGEKSISEFIDFRPTSCSVSAIPA